MLKSELDNLIKWNGKEAPFYETYYLKLNDETLGVALWIRYSLMSPVVAELALPNFGKASFATTGVQASVWAIFFDEKRPERNLALKRTFSKDDLSFHKGEFFLNIGDSWINNCASKGEVVSGNNNISWCLNWLPSKTSFRHYPWPFYALPFPSTKVVAPHLAVPVAGSFEINGVKYSIRNTILNQGHVWGKKYSSKWAWANCGMFLEDRSAVMELLARPKFGLGYLHFGGKDVRFYIHKSIFTSNSWYFEGRSFSSKIKGKIGTRPRNIVGVTYDGAAGETRYCYNTKVAEAVVDIDDQRLVSPGTTAFEFVESSPIEDIALKL